MFSGSVVKCKLQDLSKYVIYKEVILYIFWIDWLIICCLTLSG